MKRGLQTKIAKELKISRQAINDYLSGRRNASVFIADQLASLTQTDIRLWLKGGDAVSRYEAIKRIAQNS